MRLWQTITGIFRRRPGGDSLWSPSWQASLAFAPFGRGTDSGAVVNVTTAGGLPAVHRCCAFISDSLAATELRIVTESEDGGKTTVSDSDVARALAEWSYVDREMFVFNAALAGNGFAVIERNSRGGITNLASVAPRRVAAVRDGTDALFFAIAPEPGMSNTQPDIVSSTEVCHLKFRHVGDSMGGTVFGMPPIVVAAEALGLVLKAREFQAALWRNGALPMGYLTCDRMLKQSVVDRVRAQWQEFYNHGEITGRTAVLEEGLEWKPIKPGVMGSDSQLVEHARFSVEEVARLYGVPPSVLAQTHNASYSTAVEEFRSAVIHCLRPWAARMCDCLTRALLTREQRAKGMKIEAPLDHLLVAPGKEMSEYLRELTNNGILSVNEARNMLGYADVAGGEVRRVPVNTTDLLNLPKIGVPQPKPEGQ